VAQNFLFIELGDGRVMMILQECPVESVDEWSEWFDASLASLELWEDRVSGEGGQ
jgi:hypothetical protein